MYNYSLGRLVIILLIAYFTKINFYMGLIFITIVIIMSSSIYEGFSQGQAAIITTNYEVKKEKKNDPEAVSKYFKDFYCSKSNPNVPDSEKMRLWNDLANNPNSNKDIIAVAKYNTKTADTICSPDTRPTPELDLEWNTSNSKINGKCMGGWTYIGGLCYGPPGSSCSPYSWYGMRNYSDGDLNGWMSSCGVSNSNVAFANSDKIKNAKSACNSGGSSTLFSITNPSIPTLSVNNFPSLASMTNWEMDVEFKCNGGSYSWRALVGDMYNGTSWRGWGLWVSSSNGIHWSWASSTWDAPGFVVENGVKYKINVSRNDNMLTFTLTNLNTNNKSVASTGYSDRMTFGPVTIGGWINYSGERFPGEIYSVEVKKTERNSGNSSTNARVLNTPLCLVNNMSTMCASIQNIDEKITNVLNPSITPNITPYFQQDAQWLKNTYQNFCVKDKPV